jgi:hypothetical protein
VAPACRPGRSARSQAESDSVIIGVNVGSGPDPLEADRALVKSCPGFLGFQRREAGGDALDVAGATGADRDVVADQFAAGAERQHRVARLNQHLQEAQRLHARGSCCRDRRDDWGAPLRVCAGRGVDPLDEGRATALRFLRVDS